MEKIINRDNLQSFAYTNENLLQGEIRGVCVDFHGLNSIAKYSDATEPGILYAKAGVLYVYPLTDLWGWMNRECAGITDEILDVLYEKYGLPDDIPLASTGGSMGGMAGLRFPVLSSHKVSVCAVNSPVCDFVYHVTERPDLPKTIYHALYSYEGKFDDALAASSPYHTTALMPRIPYYIVHGDADKSVNKEMHSDRLVAKMRSEGFDLVYDEVPGMTHCLLDYEHAAKYYGFIVSHLVNKKA